MRKGVKLIKDISGDQFGGLKVLEFSHIHKRRSYWTCKCDCGSITIQCRKNLQEKNVRSCGCVPKAGSSPFNLRSFEDCAKHKINCLMNRSKWVGKCLIWQGCLNEEGHGRCSFLNKSMLIKDFLWFLKHRMPIGKCRVVMICGNRSCININHMGVEAYVRRNSTIDGLLKISKDRRE